MNAPVEPDRSYFNQGQQVNADYIEWVVYVDQRLRESVQAHALTRKETDRLRALYVRTPATDLAIQFLRMRNAVALVGPPGSGRRITGVAVIAELGATPHPVYLDPEIGRRELPADPGCGYLVDIDDQAVQDNPGLRDLIAEYGVRLAAIDSYLVVTATSEAWKMLGAQSEIKSVVVQAPDSVAVFKASLEYLRPNGADRWMNEPDIIKVLASASPADAARLAELADAALTTTTDGDCIQEAIAAYQNWAAELSRWFRENEDGYPRALLIAAAVLNGAEAATVFHATDQLSQMVKLPRPPGGGLVGSGINRLIDQIGAKLTADGRIHLPRPAYPASVLDHVWHDRPHLRSDLQRWLVSLPGSLRDPDMQYVGYSLINLAVRQCDATLITSAVGAWAQIPACRALAVTALTEAGVSDSIGRMVRRTMYTWATSASTTESLQFTVADVCGGPFGRSFPRNAMTRLRHLSINGSPKVHDRVVIALRTLAEAPELREFMLREIVRWTGETGQVRVAAIKAFLAIAADDVTDLVSDAHSDSGRIESLTTGLRNALRDPDHVTMAREVCCKWLEAAAQAKVPVEVVTEVIARTCRDSYDIGVLAPVVWRWARASDMPAPVPRDVICAQLLEKAADRDPLAPGVSAAAVYKATGEHAG